MRVTGFPFSIFTSEGALRILPALIVVLLFSLWASYNLMLPGAFAEFGKSLAATSAFASNLYFWRTIDYFAAPASTIPLLIHGHWLSRSSSTS